MTTPQPITETHVLVNTYLALPWYFQHKTFVACVEARAARPLGVYQQAFLDGCYAPSGSDLRGAARRNGGDYARSREKVLGLIREAGFDVTIKPCKELTGRKHNIMIVTFPFNG